MKEERESMSEEEFENFLAEAIESALIFPECGETPDDNYMIRTFTDAGVLTRNRGLVVQIDGAEFQVTIVRSR